MRATGGVPTPSAVPLGHTHFSWSVGVNLPPGHTPFSWGVGAAGTVYPGEGGMMGGASTTAGGIPPAVKKGFLEARVEPVKDIKEFLSVSVRKVCCRADELHRTAEEDEANPFKNKYAARELLKQALLQMTACQQDAAVAGLESEWEDDMARAEHLMGVNLVETEEISAGEKTIVAGLGKNNLVLIISPQPQETSLFLPLVSATLPLLRFPPCAHASPVNLPDPASPKCLSHPGEREEEESHRRGAPAERMRKCGEGKFVVEILDSINHLGLIWSQRGEPAKAEGFLIQATQRATPSRQTPAPPTMSNSSPQPISFGGWWIPPIKISRVNSPAGTGLRLIPCPGGGRRNLTRALSPS